LLEHALGELVADIVGLLELGDKAESLVSEFSCTEESLTRWFRESALRWQKSDMCRVFVVLDGNGSIVGFYSPSTATIYRAGVSRSSTSGLGSSEFPAALIGRLAVRDDSVHMGIDSVLLEHAISSCISISEDIGIKFIVVNPKDGVSAWYGRFGFRNSPDGRDTRMYLPVKAARARLN
jgi:predicted N-acetyltransferase YhbS